VTYDVRLTKGRRTNVLDLKSSVRDFLVDGWLLVGGRASLLVEHRGCFFHLHKNLLSSLGNLLDFELNDGLFGLELLGFSDVDLLNSLLNLGDVSVVSLSLLNDLLVLDLALLETLVML